jgi:hypothetical protein
MAGSVSRRSAIHYASANYSKSMYNLSSPTVCNLRMRKFEWAPAAIYRISREERFGVARKIYIPPISLALLWRYVPLSFRNSSHSLTLE